MSLKKIIVIGSTGMAGHMIFNHLSARQDFEIYNLAYRRILNSSTIIADVTDRETISDIIAGIRPDLIINCTGILIKGSKDNPSNAVYINAYFPHLLSSLVDENGGKLIHISTDCVFSGSRGNYQPDDIKDAQDIYGMSKALGEIINERDLTIRTSIIGPELKSDGEGLLHWFLKQHGTIYGYTEAFWTGVTTLQLARLIEETIDGQIIGLLQYSNGIKVSKFDLLQILKQSFHKTKIEIIPIPGKKSDKSLIPSHPQLVLQIPDYKTMCNELADYMENNLDQYKQYFEDFI